MSGVLFKETEDEFDTDASPESNFDSNANSPNVDVPAPINISAPAITDDLKEFV